MIRKRADILGIILSFIITFLLFFPFAVTNIDVHHDGLVMIPALDVLHGKILYRDIYSMYGPLSTYIQSAALLFFGEYIRSLRLITLIFYALTAPLLWIFWRKFLKISWCILSLILWLALPHFYDMTFHSWSSVYALFFQMLTIVILMQGNSRRTLVLGGMMTALTFWCRQSVGGFLFAAVCGAFTVSVVMSRRERKHSALAMLYFVTGFAAVILPYVAYLWQNSALTDWWKQNMELVAVFCRVVRGPSLLQIPKALLMMNERRQWYIYWIWVALPASVLVFSIREVIAGRKSGRINAGNIMIGFMLLSSWLQYYPMNDTGHAFWAATPMVGIFMLYTEKALIRILHNPGKAFILVLVFVLSVCIFRYGRGIRRITTANNSIQQPVIARGMRIPETEKAEIDLAYGILDRYFAVHPETTYIAPVHNPLYALFLPERYRSFHKLPMRWEYVNDAIYPEYDRLMYAYVHDHHPLVITHKKSLVFPGYCQYAFPEIGWEGIYFHVPKEGNVCPASL